MLAGNRTPDAVAVVDTGFSPPKSFTYRALAQRSWRVAEQLRSIVSGKPKPRVVAVVMHKGWEQVVGAVGVLRTHSVYLPIDASTPELRTTQILEASGAVAVVATRDVIIKSLKNCNVPIVIVSDDLSGDASKDCFGPFSVGDGVESRDFDLAYLIYTSGSTGKPKGVCCHHRGALNTNVYLNERFSIGDDDCVLGLSSLSFDLSVYDVFGMLGGCGRLVIPSERETADRRFLPDPSTWLALVKEHEVTLWNTVPAFMELLVTYCEQTGVQLPPSLRLVWMSGDWIPPSLPGRIRRLCSRAGGIQIISMGGATEAAIWSNLYEITDECPLEGWNSIPYGRPLRNQTMMILEEPSLNHAALHVTGMIYIGGEGVANGYFRDEVRTAKQFIVHPETGRRMFRTGDLGRLRPTPNGPELEILGREDSQVKINGFRIELGEIESAASSHDVVLDASAVVVKDVASGQQFVALYVLMNTEAEVAATRTADIVDEWATVYDRVYDSPEAEKDSTPFDDLNISGWISSYTGDMIKKSEMECWVVDTFGRIMEMGPKHILEIGFGTGMFASRLLEQPGIVSYVGTDISSKAVQRMNSFIQSRNVGNARVHLCPAHKTKSLSGLDHVDTIIMNSVVQYFPSIEYFLSVLADACALLEGSGSIFVGDVRSLPLLECFCTSIASSKHDTLDDDSISEIVGGMMLSENELCIDPALFVRLAGTVEGLPPHLEKLGSITGCKVLLKHLRDENELSKYRYDIVLSIGNKTESDRIVTSNAVDFASMNQLQSLTIDAPTLIRSIPNAMLKRDASLLGHETPVTSVSPWEISQWASSLGLCAECASSTFDVFAFDAFVYEQRDANCKSPLQKSLPTQHSPIFRPARIPHRGAWLRGAYREKFAPLQVQSYLLTWFRATSLSWKNSL